MAGERCASGVPFPDCGCRICNYRLWKEHSVPEYERIICDEIQPGDFVAHARTHVFREITEIREGPVSRTLRGPAGALNAPVRHLTTWWRPRRTTPMWRRK